MIDHLSTYASDYLATRDFYRAVFAPLGVTEQIEMVAEWNAEFPTQRMCAFGPEGRLTFWVIETRSAATPRISPLVPRIAPLWMPSMPRPWLRVGKTMASRGSAPTTTHTITALSPSTRTATMSKPSAINPNSATHRH